MRTIEQINADLIANSKTMVTGKLTPDERKAVAAMRKALMDEKAAAIAGQGKV